LEFDKVFLLSFLCVINLTKINLARYDTNLLISQAFHGLNHATLSALGLAPALIIQTNSAEELATLMLLLYANIFLGFVHLKLSVDSNENFLLFYLIGISCILTRLGELFKDGFS
jgi:hypothetical protein